MRIEELSPKSLADQFRDRTNDCRFVGPRGEIVVRNDAWSANRVYARAACERLTKGQHNWQVEHAPAGTRVCRICSHWDALGGSSGLRRHSGGRRVK